VLKFLEVPENNILEIDIQEPVDSVLKNIENTNDIRKGNVMARIRMIYLFDTAKKINALVCGTENKTENFLGYFTRFGDEASDLEPIKKYYKTQIWEMGKILGIPKKIINKAPTAGLWEEQTDELELGFTYKEADSALYYYFDEKLPEEEIVEKGISKEVIEKVLNYVKKNEFKHNLPHEFIPN
jgi:NAD+ synthase